MAVVIGASTIVRLGFGAGSSAQDMAGIISVDWSFGTNINRLYTLGGGNTTCGPTTFATIRGAQIQISVNIYGGNTPEVSTCAPQTCANSPAVMVASISPGVCGRYTAEGVQGKAVYISSYSYSKDRTQFGTETFQGTAYQTPAVEAGVYTEPEPTFVTMGLAEGDIDTEEDTMSSTIQSIVGARYRDGEILPRKYKGQVQAAALSIGEFSYSFNGVFKSVGNSTFWAPGVKASANVSIQTQPIYVAA